ncbi:MAG: tRNA (adenosine(37)-N6)-threonylcarbamoyltransferase complex ATPase subunit type 1 TsaE [Candidatus Eremiobacteraeota bacterium]|nr:tRNA (adenosine(37)-N6)-threonylcarbamoyltransferase complex ATPase subunit type 1 TsaE [Candidatus Eremiobacteraeota bacterium]
MERTFQTLAELQAFASDFARTLRAGDVVALGGPLGAGKTTFVRAAVSALLGDDRATSPTFTFWHRYDGTPPIDHIDLYRIDDPAELAELGLEDAFDSRSIVFVEWWENAPSLVPAGRYEIVLSGSGSEPRRLEMRHNV